MHIHSGNDEMISPFIQLFIEYVIIVNIASVSDKGAVPLLHIPQE